ncbi:MAG: FAD-dependent oxidoreductase [Bacteroidota bacterium]
MSGVFVVTFSKASVSVTMSSSVLVVGAGLAGACAASVLCRTHDVTVLEAGRPACGASGAAAGLANPFMARKANPAWRYAEALDALHRLLAEANATTLFRHQGVLRPASSEKQAGFFRETAMAFPTDTVWWSHEAVRERHPEIEAPHGALWLPGGGSVELPAMVETLLTTAGQRGASLRTGTRVTDWGDDAPGAFVRTGTGERLVADHVILCLGGGFVGHPSLAALGLHRVKGQTIRVRRPERLSSHRLAALPALSAGGYIIPAPTTNELVLGSSFEHAFSSLRPSPDITKLIAARAARTLPVLAQATVTSETAGVRVTRQGARKPLLGPVPGFERVWTYTALGAKGLLSAPLLALDLPVFLRDADTIPLAVSTLALDYSY